MGVLILAEGAPGTGKSRAILNLDPATTVILRPNSKDLPFKGARTKYSKEAGNLFYVPDLPSLGAFITKINSGKKIKTIIVEDFSHLLGQRVLADTNVSGYAKWNKLAVDAFESIIGIESELREDLYVILIAHTVTNVNSEGQSETFMLTPGRLLDNLIKIPSYFTYVLHSDVSENAGKIEYRFLTNRDGTGREAKSPEGCLDLKEENDYAAIIAKIDKYQRGE
jgi:hypothetical protein